MMVENIAEIGLATSPYIKHASQIVEQLFVSFQ
jgi:hypothetical protein